MRCQLSMAIDLEEEALVDAISSLWLSQYQDINIHELSNYCLLVSNQLVMVQATLTNRWPCHPVRTDFQLSSHILISSSTKFYKYTIRSDRD